MKLDERVALVTGGASGLGLATAQQLIGKGARVVILDRPNSDGEAKAKELGEGAIFAPCDVTDEATVQAAVDAAMEKWGAVHIAINCAGVGSAMRTVTKMGPFPQEMFEMCVQVNLFGTFNVLRLAANAMTRHEPDGDGERGVIVNTASVAAFDGQIGQAAYAASKAGVVGMTLPIARDLASLAIRVVTIAPGTFDTPMLSMLPDEQRQALAADIPHPKRLGDPDEFASLAVHVCENSYLNGETIRLDGGIRMAPR